MHEIKIHWDAFVASKKSDEPLNSVLHKRFYDKARHNLKFFTFHKSTPSAIVSSEMQSAFFDCGIQGWSFPVVSRVGIKPALDVRMPDPMYSAFLPELPVFPEELLDSSKSLVTALQEKGMLKDIMFADVIEGLQERLLSEGEMAACLQWWINKCQLDPGIRAQRHILLGAAVMSQDTGVKQKIPLKEIQTFLDPTNVVIPMDGPLPNHLLPIGVNQKLNSAQIQEFLQWRELSVLEWIQYIVDPAVCTQTGEFNIVDSPIWADRVFQTLGECWPTLAEVSKTTIVGLLNKLTCIPTSAGMKLPHETYFLDAAIFNGLPVINLPSGVQIGGSLKEVLADLGVRKYVDFQIVSKWFVPIPPWCTPLTQSL